MVQNSPHPYRSLLSAVFALLAAFTFTSCLGHRPPHTTSLVPFTSDGCTLFPDGTVKDRDKWCDCCQTHDRSYWQGGSADDREQADAAFRDCVLARTHDPELAKTMYLGARAGGHPFFPTWYRWGYGWPYGRGYAPLSKKEKLQVRKRLAEYAKQHPTGYCVENSKDPIPEGPALSIP